jgi:hypothetical protein
MVTLDPSDPAGQVPIGGSFAANALPTKLHEPAPPAERALNPAPVATACRRRRRRDMNFGNSLSEVVMGVSFSFTEFAFPERSVTAFSRGSFNRAY